MNAKQRRYARRHGLAISARNCLDCYLMYDDKEKVCPECGFPQSERWTIGYQRKEKSK